MAATMMNGSAIHIFPKDQIISLSIVSVLIIIIAVPANILVLLGYHSSRTIRAKPSSTLIMSLTFAELIASVAVIPSQVLQTNMPDLVANDEELCLFFGIILYPVYIVISETLAFMSIDRLLAVKSMLRYSALVTRKRVLAFVVFTWIHGLIFVTTIGLFAFRVNYNYHVGSCAIVFDDRIAMTIIVIIIYGLTPLGVIVVCNCITALHLRRHNARIHVQGRSINKGRNAAKKVLEKKIAYMVIWMNITCLICWTPMMIVTILQVTPAYPTPLFNSVANAILHVSVIFNAVLNLYFRTDLRNAITLLCLRRGDVEDRRDAGSNVNS